VRPTEILVAEDDEANRLLTLQQLERLGHSARGAAAGDEAVAAVAEHPFAMVLMDCNMPGLDGFAATRAIRAAEEGTDRRTVIVAITAGGLEDDRAACLDAGMDDYLTKPVLLADLRRLIGKWIEGAAGASFAEEELDAPATEGWAGPVDREAFDRFRSEVGGDQFAALFVRVFLRELGGRVAGIRNARDEGDVETLRRLAHTLKSSSATIGARRLAELCRRLEAAVAGDAAMAVLTEELVEEAAAVQGELERRGFEPADAVA
jgi:CheY-like chemotaxis protein/HPt (histidine-containing phosphotransfer) domain-containing protein